MQATNLVRTTIRASAPLQLPIIVWIPFQAIHSVHRCWCYWRRFQIYKDPNNFATLAAGNAAYFLGADLPVIRGIAQAVMIANRIFLCIEKQATLCTHCKELVLAVKGHYMPHDRANWSSYSKANFASPSTRLWCKTFGYSTTLRMQRIAYCAYLILVDSFQLSMLMMDAAESFSSDSYNNGHHVREFFYNTSASVDLLVNNREKLLLEMQKHRGVIQAILSTMGVPLTADQIIASLSKGLSSAATLNVASQKAQAMFGRLMADFLGKGFFGFLFGIGLSEYVPQVLVCNLFIHRQKKEPEANRYPPINWVALRSKSHLLKPLPQPASPEKPLTHFISPPKSPLKKGLGKQ